MKKLRLLLMVCVIFVLTTVISTASNSKSIMLDYIGQYSEGKAVAGVWSNGWKYGYIDSKGNVKIEIKFADAEDFENGLAAVGVLDSNKKIKYGFIKSDGSYLIKPIFDEVDNFKKIPNTSIEVAKVGIGDYKSRKYGFIKKDGSYFVTPQYDYVCDYSNNSSGCGYTPVYIKKDGKNFYGILDWNGKLIIDTKYSFISISEYDVKDGYIIINEESLSGYYNIRTKELVEPEYSYVQIRDNGVYLTKKFDGKEKVGFHFNNGVIIKPKYDDISYRNPGDILYEIKLNGKFGLIDKNGNEVFEPIYDEIRYIGHFIFIKRDGKISVISEDGKAILDNQLDKVSYYENFNLLGIVVNGKEGLLNMDDNSYLVEPKYDKIELYFEDGYAKVYLNNKQGIINRTGNILLEPVYDYIYTNFYLNKIKEEKTNPDGSKTYTYRDDKSKPPVVKVKKDGKEFYLNSDFTPMKQTGNSAVGDFDSIGSFEDGMARVEKGGKIGYVREDLTYIVKPVWDSAFRAVNTASGKDEYYDYFHIQKGDKWGIVFMDGTVIEPVSETMCNVGENITLVKINNKWRYISKKNKFLNNEEYVYAYPFTEGVGLVQKTYIENYFIDTNGKRVSDIYTGATSYGDGLAFVYGNSGGKYIDHTGKTVIGEKMNLLYGYTFCNGTAVASVQQNGVCLYGILKKDGTWLVKPIFDKVEDYGFGKYKYYLKGKEAEVTSNGKITWK